MPANHYDLHLLGWHSFQQLCLAVASEVLGQSVESFLDGNDGGRDGAFKGKWKPEGKEQFEGNFVIQCKFTSRRDHNLLPSDISDEIKKAKLLVDRGLCDVYILMTNAGISAVNTAKIKNSLQNVGIKQVAIYGSTWISSKIDLYSKLRMNVPRLYGLGDLSQILDERSYKQTRALLAELRPELAKTVVTETYKQALNSINKYGFVLLVGAPAAGKTTIASLLAMCAVDEWKSLTLKLETPEQVKQHWNTEEQSQFIWIDDAFGTTQYESHLVMGWNRIFDSINTMVKRGHRIVMTSRDYIYNQARRDLKAGAFPLLNESQVVIDVKDLSSLEKDQILYNHLKLGTQSKKFISSIKPHLPLVASNEQFIPETARRLGNPLFTKELLPTKIDLEHFVVSQEQLLVEIMQGMSDDNQAALALIYMRNGVLESPVDLSLTESRAIERLGSTEGQCIKAMDYLNGSLVQLLDTDTSRVWRYKHPTIGDAFALVLSASPEHLKIFVDGTSIEKLMDLVTCGNTETEKATIIPVSLFDTMADKMYEYTQNLTSFKERYPRNRRLYSFLRDRCNKEFLTRYIKKDPDLLRKVTNIMPEFWFNAELGVARRLFEEHILPESYRAILVTKLTEAALGGDDLSPVYDKNLHVFFLQDELEDFLEDVQVSLLPNLRDVRDLWESQFNNDRDPADHMSELISQLQEIAKTYPTWKNIQNLVKDELDMIEDWISDRGDGSSEISSRNRGELLQSSAHGFGNRSLFDDVDL